MKSLVEHCKVYCGVACVDGSCPMANRDEYAEQGYDLIERCEDCFYYKGCDDCAFFGDWSCPKVSVSP